jgi:hypothetical protein
MTECVDDWKFQCCAGVSINWVGRRSTSWVKCQEQHLGGSTEVTLAASGRRAGTNKRVSVNDSPVHRGYQTVHFHNVKFNVPDLTCRALLASSSLFNGALLRHPSTYISTGFAGALK